MLTDSVKSLVKAIEEQKQAHANQIETLVAQIEQDPACRYVDTSHRLEGGISVNVSGSRRRISANWSPNVQLRSGSGTPA